MNLGVEEKLRHINNQMVAAGIKPLTAQEIVPMLEKLEIPTPIRGIKRKPPPDRILPPIAGAGPMGDAMNLRLNPQEVEPGMPRVPGQASPYATLQGPF